MIESPSLNTKTTKVPKSMAYLLPLTILSTTLRMFIPTIGGTIIGVTLDNLLGRAPMFTFIMISTGFVISAVLIAIQIKKVRKS